MAVGSLIKLVYFSKNNTSLGDDDDNNKHLVLQGRLHFTKFETSKINDCIEFIRSKKLHLCGMCFLTSFASLISCSFILNSLLKYVVVIIVTDDLGKGILVLIGETALLNYFGRHLLL